MTRLILAALLVPSVAQAHPGNHADVAWLVLRGRS